MDRLLREHVPSSALPELLEQSNNVTFGGLNQLWIGLARRRRAPAKDQAHQETGSSHFVLQDRDRIGRFIEVLKLP